MTIERLTEMDTIQLIHYLTAQSLDELKSLAKRVSIERYNKYDIRYSSVYQQISNLIVQRTTDSATKYRLQNYKTR
jgi:hypothetical protein